MAPDTPREERRRRLSGKRRPEPDDDGVLLPTPPDGGWGWMVVLGSFLIHVIADGVAYSFGIFYIEFLEHFRAGRGPTGWIGSLMVGITWGSGKASLSSVLKFPVAKSYFYLGQCCRKFEISVLSLPQQFYVFHSSRSYRECADKQIWMPRSYHCWINRCFLWFHPEHICTQHLVHVLQFRCHWGYGHFVLIL